MMGLEWRALEAARVEIYDGTRVRGVEMEEEN